VERTSSLSGKSRLGKIELGRVGQVPEGHGHHGLSILGIRILPSKGVDESRRRFDRSELPGEIEELPVGRLHGDSIAASDTKVELYRGSSEAARAPPLRQLLGFGARLEDERTRCAHNAIQVEGQSAGVRDHDSPVP